jgi:hypothetical protein
MSAVVIALTTPFYSIADPQGLFDIKDVPEGDYELHVWVEGQHQNSLDKLMRRVHIAAGVIDLGEIQAAPRAREQHLNKFGRPYDPSTGSTY